MDLIEQYRELKHQFAERDERYRITSAVRRGEVQEVLPGEFPDNWPKPITANVIETASRDFAEMLGALPQISCPPRSLTSQAAKLAADKRTKVVHGWLGRSRLQSQLYSGADSYFLLGAFAFIVEPNFYSHCPTIRVDDASGAYYTRDFTGRVQRYYKCWRETIDSLVAKFPEHEAVLRNRRIGHFGDEQSDSGSMQLEVVKCYSPDKTCLFIPDRELVVREASNHLNETPVFIAERYRWDGQARGQFDDVAWTQMARARVALYGLQLADEALNAPTILPNDVNQLSMGPGATIYTSDPQGPRRMDLSVPQEAFTEGALLQQEERLGARYPEGMTGSIDASVITGQGVNALLGQANIQIKVAQELVAIALKDALSHMLRMDEMFWGDMEKSIDGQYEGERFSERYVPSKHIKGDYTVDATYGFASGLDPNRALVFMLQLRADGNLSRDTMMRHMGHLFGVGAQQELEKRDAEDLEDALKQGIFQLAASVGQMPQMGMNPVPVVRQMAIIIEAREKGKTLHDAVLMALETPMEELDPQAAEESQQDPLAALMGGGGGGGEAPALGTPPQGGSPDLAMTLAGLTQGGQANLQSNVSRQDRTG